MILFFEYSQGNGALTETIHVDLVNSDISCQDFSPGIFVSPGQKMAQAEAKVSIHGTTAFKAALAAIGRLQDHVQNNVGRNFGSQVFLYYSATGGYLYRARVYSVTFANEGGANYYTAQNRNLPAVLTIIHGVWQGELTQIPLSNLHETNNTSGLQVDNTTDVNQDHHMVIAKEDVIGDIPAPIRLEITNPSATVDIYQFWVSNNVNSYNPLFEDVLEGELSVPIGRPASPQVYAAASNGSAERLSITLEADVDFMYWQFTTTQGGYMGGNQFHVLIRSIQNSLLPSIYWRFHIEKLNETYIYWKGEQVVFPNTGPNLNTGDYGVIRLPPWRLDSGAASAEFDLVLSAQLVDGAAAATVDIDAVYLFPVDSFRNIKIPGLLENLRLIDDMTVDDSWIDTGGGNTRRGDVVGLGSQILVHPYRDQQLSMIWSHTAGDTADQYVTVKAYYRPLFLVV